MKATIDDLWEMLGAVHRDFSLAYTHLQTQAEDTGYHRRAYVRAAFAAIEAITFFLKQYALSMKSELFGRNETALLMDEVYSLDDKGNVAVQPKFLQLSPNYVFAMKMFSRVMKSPFELRKGTEWEAFKKGIEARNRITHPKSPESLEVSDQERDNVLTAYRWVVGSIIDCVAQANSALRSEVERIAKEHGIDV